MRKKRQQEETSFKISALPPAPGAMKQDMKRGGKKSLKCRPEQKYRQHKTIQNITIRSYYCSEECLVFQEHPVTNSSEIIAGEE